MSRLWYYIRFFWIALPKMYRFAQEGYNLRRAVWDEQARVAKYIKSYNNRILEKAKGSEITFNSTGAPKNYLPGKR